jgi:hypothetical protein
LVVSLGVNSLLLNAAPAEQAPKPQSEEDIKALYVYNFAKYTTWESNARTNGQAPFVVGVAGPDTKMYASLEHMLKPLSIEGRPIKVERYDAQKEPNYQVLFFAKEKQWQEILEKLKDKAVLTIGEIGGFSKSGMIELVTDQRKGKIEFKINVEAGQEAGLTFDTRLLRMASEVIKPRPSSINEARSGSGG